MIKDVSLEATFENPPKPGEWTFEDYRQLTAETETRYEVIEGVLYEMPLPPTLHRLLVTKLVIRLGNLIEKDKLGILYLSPIDVVMSDKATPVQPDLVFIRDERRNIVKENHIKGSPDLVVEILSLSSIRYDRVTKFKVYETSGVHEYWILNPKTHSLEIYNLEEGLYNLFNEYSADEPILSPLFGDLAFTIGSLFE